MGSSDATPRRESRTTTLSASNIIKYRYNSKRYFQYLETIYDVLSLPLAFVPTSTIIGLLWRQRKARRTDKSPLRQRGGTRC